AMSDAGLPVRAVVLEVAAATPVGRSATASAAAMRAGVSRFSLRWSARIAGPDAVTISAAPYLPRFDPDARPAVVERMIALAEACASQLPLDPGLLGGSKLPVFLGVPSARPGLPDGADAAVAEGLSAALGGRGFAPSLETLALDHAAGLTALERAVRAIEAREA